MHKTMKDALLLVVFFSLLLSNALFAQDTGCREPGKTWVHGKLECGDTLEPMEGCEVILQVRWAGLIIDEVRVTTDRQGLYSACLRCPGRPNLGGWSLYVQACCGASWETTVRGCPDEIQVPTLYCPECGAPDPGGPCGQGKTLAVGYVLCGNGDPVVACPIEIILRDRRDPTYEKRFQTRTDDCGMYRICIPCPPERGGVFLTVEAQCCRESLGPIRYAGDCRPVLVLPGLVCNDCDEDPKPCPDDQTLLKGRVLCGGFGRTEGPAAGCNVHVEVVCNDRRSPVFEADFVTDSEGGFSGCIPCCPGGSLILVTPECCGETFEYATADCPPELTLPDIFCPCDNDPPQRPCAGENETLLSGVVLCAVNDPTDPDRPMPLAGCEVEVSVERCGLREIYTAVTDENGRYELCVPCDRCPGMMAQVQTRCCERAAPVFEFVPGCPPAKELPPVLCLGCP